MGGGRRTLAFVAIVLAIPFTTGLAIGVLEGGAQDFVLFIAPEIWLGSTIAVVVAVARNRRQYGKGSSALGAVGATIGYGALVFPACCLLGYLATGSGIG